MKRIISLLLVFAMIGTFTACGKNQKDQNEIVNKTIEFTDSLGRSVRIPEKPEKIALSGPVAQIVCFALCPDKLVGTALAWSDRTKELGLVSEKYMNLPVLGQLHGGMGNMNPEALLSAGAQLVIDIGEAKKDLAIELDDLQLQLGIPIVHIDCHTDNMSEVYEILGKLTGMENEAAKIAEYIENVCGGILETASGIEKKSAVWLLNNGQNVIAKGSYHSEIIDVLADNAAVIESPSSKGTGNILDREQLLLWDPEYIFADNAETKQSLTDDPALRALSAVKSGNIYVVPDAPYCWFGTPPSVQRILGMLWASQILYPDAFGSDLYTRIAEYFNIFYHTELSEEQYNALVFCSD